MFNKNLIYTKMECWNWLADHNLIFLNPRWSDLFVVQSWPVISNSSQQVAVRSCHASLLNLMQCHWLDYLLLFTKVSGK